LGKNDHLREYKSVRRWMKRRASSSHKGMLSNIGQFMDYLEKESSEFNDTDPDGLIAYQQEYKDYAYLMKLKNGFRTQQPPMDETY
jgi:hypothetical protein